MCRARKVPTAPETEAPPNRRRPPRNPSRQKPTRRTFRDVRPISRSHRELPGKFESTNQILAGIILVGRLDTARALLSGAAAGKSVVCCAVAGLVVRTALLLREAHLPALEL